MEKKSFWSYIKLWISRAFQNTYKDWFGWDMKALITPILLALGFEFYWFEYGMSQTESEFIKWLVTVVAPLGIVFTVTFILELITSPYKIFNEQQENFDVADKKQQEKIDALIRKTDDLEKELSEKPKTPLGLLKKFIQDTIDKALTLKTQENFSYLKLLHLREIFFKGLELAFGHLEKENMRMSDVEFYPIFALIQKGQPVPQELVVSTLDKFIQNLGIFKIDITHEGFIRGFNPLDLEDLWKRWQG